MRLTALSAALLLAACGGQGIEPASAPADAAGAAEALAPDAPKGSTAAPLPAGSHSVQGRVATISLPYRSMDGLAWVNATRAADATPFSFKGLDVRPGGGPGGTDLAVFTFEADRPGKATLAFGLVPQGQMLIGPETMVYKGEPAQRYTAEVSAQ